MNAIEQELLSAFDGHHVEAVEAALRGGARADRPIDGKLPIHWLLEEYTRSDRLPACLRLLAAGGASLPEPGLMAVLCDDAAAIQAAVAADPACLFRTVSLRSAFCSLVDATLLHVAAEYGYPLAAQTLIDLGANVNAAAGLDAHGLNGHTPIFHTVNSNRNRARPVMDLLVRAGADLDHRLRGLWWGQQYPWETLFFDITPMAFAQMGLLPQVHRAEADIYDNLQALAAHRHWPLPPLQNIPNRYLTHV